MKHLIAALNKITASMQDDPKYEEMKEMFLEGECYSFALALHDKFGYKLQKATHYGDTEWSGEEGEEILHAWAMDGNTVVDVVGRRKEDAKEMMTDLIADTDSFEYSYDDLVIDDTTKKELKELQNICVPNAYKIAKQWIEKYESEYASKNKIKKKKKK